MDKDAEMAIVAISAKLDDVKGSLSSFVGKMEHEPITWPSALNSFSALSGQMSTVMRQLTHDKLSPLYQYLVLPKQVSSERDQELEKTTEGRVPVLHHEILPDYMRTKLDLDLEGQQKELYSHAASIPQTDFEEGVAKYNQALESITVIIDDANEDKHKNKIDTLQPTSSEDTKKLVASYLNCSGLQQMSHNRRAMLIGRHLNPQQMVHPHHQPPGAVQRSNTLSRVAPPTRPMHPPQPHVIPHPQSGFTGSPYKK